MAIRKVRSRALEGDPLWYKDIVIYQLHVRAFYDANTDGIGDFVGLTEKLDYLAELGVSAVWLLPFYPSPLKDDGYDIADYWQIHGSYGNIKDFQRFLEEAHKRNLRVITELVINHTSDQHAWFQRARRAKPGSPERDFYVWSDTPERFQEARIIFKDFEHSNWAWDHVASAYYWHRFYSHQPDLNFDNPKVRRSVTKVLDYWFDMGVDGLRLDAVPYLYEREGTNCENLPETHEFLKQLRRHMDNQFKNRMLLAEANQWPEDAVEYFGDNDECHLAFHFPLMPRLYMAVSLEDRFPIIDIMQQTPTIPDQCQWVMFLRNHDELTLEMVTEEERDYMYRAYAQEFRARINLGIRRRLAPLLSNDRRSIELLNALLFSLPGTPVVYYGDEIGMGDNIYLGDRNGVRTPMQWSADRNAGFSRANSQSLFLPVIIDPEYHYETVNVENQRNNPQSLLRWMQRIIALRKRFKAFGRGTLEFLQPENRKVLVFIRSYESERILVVANLSGTAQYVELALGSYAGMVPIEVFGQVQFPPITSQPYFLTLGPRSFYWFSLEPSRHEATELAPLVDPPILDVPLRWHELLGRSYRPSLEAAIGGFFETRRWIMESGKQIKRLVIRDSFVVDKTSNGSALLVAKVDYLQGESELFLLHCSYLHGADAERAEQDLSQDIIARVRVFERPERGILLSGFAGENLGQKLLELITGRRTLAGSDGTLAGVPLNVLRRHSGRKLPPAGTPRSDQLLITLPFGEDYILKIYRKIEEGIQPELELLRYLNEVKQFPHVPQIVGYLDYRTPRGTVATAGVLVTRFTAEGDAREQALSAARLYLERAIARSDEIQKVLDEGQNPLTMLLDADPVSLADELVGGYLESARLMGERVAEFHAALGDSGADPLFAPEPFSELYQRSLYQSIRTETRLALHAAAEHLNALPEEVRELLRELLAKERELLDMVRRMLTKRIYSLRIRCGELDLKRLLDTGKDYLIGDVGGDLRRPIGERRIKRSPVRDLGGLLASFFDVANAAALTELLGGPQRAEESIEDRPQRIPLATYWFVAVGSSFLRGYTEAAQEGPKLLPAAPDLRSLLLIFLLERLIAELPGLSAQSPLLLKSRLQLLLDLMNLQETQGAAE